ncbi:DUF6705 family protein [Chryseobacterium soli]|nr:DUF6705 family protein [Chryseobacterium soli]
MKKIFLFILFSVAIYTKAQQVYSLRPTEIDLPENSYQKDINNELPAYEGTWKGTWNNKIIYVNFKKILNTYNAVTKYYRDYLVARFKVTDLNGNIIFDNTNLEDNKTKIVGVNFRRYGDKYSLIYIDKDLCDTSGNIVINFTDPSKTQLNWKYNEGSNMITTDCQYYSTTPFPTALPKEIVLIKQ